MVPILMSALAVDVAAKMASAALATPADTARIMHSSLDRF
jgi:hypothetical protein